jgi:uncharacterized RDD family membrane protein YckC
MIEDNPYASPEFDPAPEKIMVIKHEVAGRLTRLIASILNGIIPSALMMPFMFLLFKEIANDSNSNSEEQLLKTLGITMLVMLLYAAYNIYLIFKFQQTLGKRIMSIKVVRSDGSPCSGSRYLFLRVILTQIIAGSIPFGTIIDVLFIFRDTKECLHDNLAETMVVKC